MAFELLKWNLYKFSRIQWNVATYIVYMHLSMYTPFIANMYAIALLTRLIGLIDTKTFK